MLDFEEDLAKFLTEKFGECWSYEYCGEGEKRGFSLVLEVWGEEEE